MAFQKHKTDPELGLKVHEYLKDKGIETPMIKSQIEKDPKSKITEIENLMSKIHDILGISTEDDSIVDTPKRIAKMLVLDDFWGLHPENFPKMTTIENKFSVEDEGQPGQMILVGPINLVSRCEHHWEKILGEVHIAYIPSKRVLGLSKFARLVEYFAKRPQVQERLLRQICETAKLILETEHVAVTIRAEHLCMTTRGIEDPCAATTNSALSGAFLVDGSTRSEYFSMIVNPFSRK